MATEEQVENLKKEVRSVLLSQTDGKGIPASKFIKIYKNLLMKPLNYREMGHRNLEEMMKTMPDVTRIEFHPKTDEAHFFGVLDKTSYVGVGARKASGATSDKGSTIKGKQKRNKERGNKYRDKRFSERDNMESKSDVSKKQRPRSSQKSVFRSDINSSKTMNSVTKNSSMADRDEPVDSEDGYCPPDSGVEKKDVKSGLHANMKGMWAVCFAKENQAGKSREEVMEEFSVAGEVAEYGQSARFVFIRYWKREDAAKAMDILGSEYHVRIPEEKGGTRSANPNKAQNNEHHRNDERPKETGGHQKIKSPENFKNNERHGNDGGHKAIGDEQNVQSHVNKEDDWDDDSPGSKQSNENPDKSKNVDLISGYYGEASPPRDGNNNREKRHSETQGKERNSSGSTASSGTPSSRTLFIGNIHPFAVKEKVEKSFQHYKTELIRAFGEKHFAFVKFVTRKEAERCMSLRHLHEPYTFEWAKEDSHSRADKSHRTSVAGQNPQSQENDIRDVNFDVERAKERAKHLEMVSQKFPSQKENEVSQKFPSQKENEASQKFPSQKENEASQKSQGQKENEASQKFPSQKENEVSQKFQSQKENEASQKFQSQKENEASQKFQSQKENEVSQKFPSQKENEVSQKFPSQKENEVSQKFPSQKENEAHHAQSKDGSERQRVNEPSLNNTESIQRKGPGQTKFNGRQEISKFINHNQGQKSQNRERESKFDHGGAKSKDNGYQSGSNSRGSVHSKGSKGYSNKNFSHKNGYVQKNSYDEMPPLDDSNDMPELEEGMPDLQISHDDGLASFSDSLSLTGSGVERGVSVFVSHFPRLTTVEMLMELFRPYQGRSVSLKRTFYTPQAFVKVSSAIAAEQAVRDLNNRIFFGAVLHVDIKKEDVEEFATLLMEEKESQSSLAPTVCGMSVLSGGHNTTVPKSMQYASMTEMASCCGMPFYIEGFLRKRFDVLVTTVVDRSYFWGHIQYMVDELRLFQRVREGLQKIPFKTPVPPGVNMGMVRSDKEWFRVWIMEDLPSDFARILCIDYGKEDVVKRSDICQVPEVFWKVLPIAAPFFIRSGQSPVPNMVISATLLDKKDFILHVDLR